MFLPRDLSLNLDKPEHRRLLEDLAVVVVDSSTAASSSSNSNLSTTSSLHHRHFHDRYTATEEQRIAASCWSNVREFSLLGSSDTTAPTSVLQLRAVLQMAKYLTSFSLFSITLLGSGQDFEEWANVLQVHQHLRQIHFVDCSVLECSCSSSSQDVDCLMEEEDNEEIESGHSSMMDCIALALSNIPTLECVEMYCLPTLLDDGHEHDDDNDTIMSSASATNEEEGEEESNDDVMLSPEEVVQEGRVVVEPQRASQRRRRMMRNSERTTRHYPNRGMSLSPGAIATLCAASPSLRSLSLEDCDLQDEHIALMSLALATNRTLQDLKLFGCNISDRGSTVLAQMLLINQGLEKLDLSNNDIHDDGCVAIARALCYHPTLRWLSLAGNECVMRHVPLPSSSSSSSRGNTDIQQQQLLNDNISTTLVSNSTGLGFEALSQMLQENPILENLILEDYEREISLIPSTDVTPVAE